MVENLQHNNKPYMSIVEQPQSYGFRFRYACEGKSHGGLPGENSRKDRKTFPEIKIHNYQGPARITVRLVTDDPVPVPHAHELIGKHCKKGICMVELKGDTQMKYTFSNLGILHVTKKRVVEILTERIIESMRLDRMIQQNLPPNTDITAKEKEHARAQAESQSKNMSLNKVRLCFQAYLQDSQGNYSHLLPSVLSNPINDCKAPGAAALKICRMDKHAGCCRGQDEVFLLCDKVQKDDIAVRFYEEDSEGNVRWEAYGAFGPADVHRQYAIVFKTPEYLDPSILKAVSVQVQLKRISDGVTSDPKPFTYYPEPVDQEEVSKKRKKNIFPFGGSGSSGYGGGMNNGSNGTSWTVNTNHSQGSPQNNMNSVSQGSGGGVSDCYNFDPYATPDMVKQEPMEFKFEGQDYKFDIDWAFGSMPAASFPSFQARGTSLGMSRLPSTVEIDGERGYVSRRAIPVEDREGAGVGRGAGEGGKGAEDAGKGAGQGAGKGVVKGAEGGSSKVSGKKDADSKSSDSKSDASKPQDSTTAKPPKPPSSLPRPAPRGGATGGVGGGGKMDDGRLHSYLESGIGMDSLVDEELDEEEEVGEKGDTEEVKEKGDVEESEKDHGEEQTEQEEEQEEEEEVVVVDDSQHRYEIEQYRYMLTRARGEAAAMTSILQRVSERSLAALQDYATTGDVEAVLRVYRQLVGAQDDNGDSTLHLAVIHKRNAALRHLLLVLATIPNCNAINTYNDLRQTPLHLAALTNEPELCELLLSQGADQELPDRHGNTPVHIAAMAGYAGVLAKLLAYPHPAAQWPRPFPNIDALNFDGMSAVHLSAMQGHIRCLSQLLRVNADVNLPDGKCGYTPLHHAVDNANLAIVGHLLLEGNADPNIPCFAGNTPLHLAVGNDNIGIVAVLISARADPYLENSECVIYSDSEDEEEEGAESKKEKEESKKEESQGVEAKEDAKEEIDETAGLSAMDMAAGNYRMMRILRGDSTLEDLSGTTTSIGGATTDSGVLTSYDSAAAADEDSHCASLASDQPELLVSDVDFLTLKKLARLLDSTGGWEELAPKLGLETLLPALQSRPSPSQMLLDNFEALQGTVNHLLSVLEKMNRTDAVELLRQALKEAKKQANTPVEHET